MKKYFTIASLLLLLTITPVVASNSKIDDKNKKVGSSQVCEPDAEYKNHGDYVSCVAHTHPGGAVVSEAAKSDIGKKSKEASPTPIFSPSPVVSPSPSVSPTVEPSPSVSPSPEATPSPDVSPSPEATVGATVEVSESVITNLIAKLNELVEQLENLLD